MAMLSIESLRQDHRDIEVLLDRAMEAIEPFDLNAVARRVNALGDFVEKLHMPKEDEVLFSELARHAMDLAVGPIHALQREHDLFRAYLQAVKTELARGAVGRSVDRERIITSVRAMNTTLRAHMKKEDGVLFILAERVIPAVHDPVLVQRFGEVEAKGLGLEEADRLRRLVRGQLEDDSPFSSESVTTAVRPRGSNLEARTLAGPEEPMDETFEGANAGRRIFDDGHHRNVLLHDFGRGLSVQANQFLIVDGNEGMVLDPGGPKVYANVFAETQLVLRGGKLRYIFLSHQDPDIGTSLNAWLLDTDADALISKLWVRFVPHFGIDSLLKHRLIGVPDEGVEVELGRSKLLLVPAHFLHSAGNFHVYDPVSKVLFSGDLGASLATSERVVRDFDAHIPSMRSFHERYMASRRAARAWAERIRDLDIQVIAPQHGAMFVGAPMVRKLIDWCTQVPCGVDLLDDQD